MKSSTGRYDGSIHLASMTDIAVAERVGIARDVAPPSYPMRRIRKKNIGNPFATCSSTEYCGLLELAPTAGPVEELSRRVVNNWELLDGGIRLSQVVGMLLDYRCHMWRLGAWATRASLIGWRFHIDNQFTRTRLVDLYIHTSSFPFSFYRITCTCPYIQE